MGLIGAAGQQAKKVRRKLHCSKAVSLGNRCNIQLQKEKATGLLAARESGPKTTATKGCTVKGCLSTIVLGERNPQSRCCFGLVLSLLYSLNPEHRNFPLQTFTQGFGAGREAQT